MITVQFLWRPSKKLQNHFTGNLSGKGIKIILPPTADKGKYRYPKIQEADVLVGWRISGKQLKKATKCKLLLVPGHGVKRMADLFNKHNFSKSIILANSHGNSIATSQHALALLLSLSNKIICHHEFMKKGQWRTSDEVGATFLLHKKTVGFLGYGAINQRIHQLMKGFDLSVKVLKRKLSKKEESKQYFKPNQLTRFLQTIDILIIGVPLTDITAGLIGKKELKALGKNGLLVNVSRGKVIKEKALYKALKNKTIAGAAIDVWYDYHSASDKKGRIFPFSFPFHKLNNIVLSPHRGGSPLDNPYRFEDVIDNLIQFSEGRPLRNIVDLDREY